MGLIVFLCYILINIDEYNTLSNIPCNNQIIHSIPFRINAYTVYTTTFSPFSPCLRHYVCISAMDGHKVHLESPYSTYALCVVGHCTSLKSNRSAIF